MRKTKIIATIGPASNNKQTIMEMAKAGMNVARINMSHGSHEVHQQNINIVKEVRKELNKAIAIMIDTKGPEIRLKEFENGSVVVEDSSEFVIKHDSVLGNSKMANVTCEDFYLKVKIGDVILFCDGLVKMIVKNIENKDIVCTVLIGGNLSTSKSLNVPNVYLNLPYMSEKDMLDVKFAIENDVDYIAASFVSTKEDVVVLQKFLQANNANNIKIIAKIENSTGIENVDEILEIVDGMMIARGDLGVEIPYERLPKIQKEIIKKCISKGKRVITATEMLESMILNPRPTRAETSDVANAVYDGSSAIMLSGETAVGKYPVKAVATMSDIAEFTEAGIHYKKRFLMQDFSIETIADAISNTAVKASLDLKCSAIFVVTDSGSSAKMISRFKPICPIIAVTTNIKTYYQLAMCWGIIPFFAKEQKTIDELFADTVNINNNDFDFIHLGDNIVYVASTVVGKTGHTNILKIEQVK